MHHLYINVIYLFILSFLHFEARDFFIDILFNDFCIDYIEIS